MLVVVCVSPVSHESYVSIPHPHLHTPAIGGQVAELIAILGKLEGSMLSCVGGKEMSMLADSR